MESANTTATPNSAFYSVFTVPMSAVPIVTASSPIPDERRQKFGPNKEVIEACR